jgi:DNA-binding MarR family transcriptional regulator
LLDDAVRYYLWIMSLNRDITATIVTLARLIRTEADKRARLHGMTRAQWTILINLERQPGLLQKELAEVLEVEPITVARLVDRLEARGMVERRGDPTDRRCWRLHLTDASRPLMSEIGHQLDDLAAIAVDGLDPELLASILPALTQMREQVAAEIRRTPVPPPPDDKLEEVA